MSKLTRETSDLIHDALCEIDAIVKGAEALIEVTETTDENYVSAKHLMKLASDKLMQIHETIDLERIKS